MKPPLSLVTLLSQTDDKMESETQRVNKCALTYYLLKLLIDATSALAMKPTVLLRGVEVHENILGFVPWTWRDSNCFEVVLLKRIQYGVKSIV